MKKYLLSSQKYFRSKPECAAPVDEAVAAVDGAVLVHPDEGLGDRLAALGVHGEGAPVPVHRAAQLPQLVVDGVTVLLLPLEHLHQSQLSIETADQPQISIETADQSQIRIHLLKELLPAEVVAAEPLLPRQLLLHDNLGSENRLTNHKPVLS